MPRTETVKKTKAVRGKPRKFQQSITINVHKDVLKTIGLCEITTHIVGSLKRLHDRAKNGKDDKNSYDDHFSYEERISGLLEIKLKKFKTLFTDSSSLMLEVYVDDKRCQSLFKKRYRVTVKFPLTSSIVNMYFGAFKGGDYISIYHIELVNM